MKFLKIKISMLINYFLFGILLNSVGIVILQSQRYFNISESLASILEAFKDLSIAIVSFFVASFITRLGYKKSMQIGLAVVAIACFVIPSLKTFLAIKLLFAATGISFALIKISVFGSIGLITKTEKEHLSFMSFMESFFMVGVLSGALFFSYFIDDKNASSAHWFTVYYYIGGFLVLAFLLLSTSQLDETAVKPKSCITLQQSFASMITLLALSVVFSFIISVFLYVLIEQSIQSWLPTFNNKILKLPSTLSIQMASVFAGFVALGRFVAGFVFKKMPWYTCLITCIAMCAILVLVAMPFASATPKTSIVNWEDVPLVAYIIPLIGFFLAPIYPAINSLVLASLPKEKHAAMSGLIVVFSALGGTLGSLITGNIFQYLGGIKAFYFSIIPMSLLIVSLFLFNKIRKSTVEPAHSKT